MRPNIRVERVAAMHLDFDGDGIQTGVVAVASALPAAVIRLVYRHRPEFMRTQTTESPWKSGRVALLLLASLCYLPVGAAQYFYSVDFHSPLNQVGQPPATAAGFQTPSSIVFGTPTVVSSFGHLTEQPLLFSGIYYQQIQFALARSVPDYFVDFDFETRNLNPSLFAFVVVFDTPGVDVFYLHGGGYIGVPPANSEYLPGWSDDELHHMHIGVNLAASSWTFQLDDREPVTGHFFSNSGDILSMRMNLSAWRASTPDNSNVQVAVDNILIGTSIPEPSSLALVVPGGGVCLLLRLRKCKA